MPIGKINIPIWFHCSLMEDKRKMRHRGPTLIGTPKVTSH